MPLSFRLMRADDPFLDRYARGTRSMTASEIRALFAVASRPEIVSLAGGMPFTAALPFDVVGDMVAEVVADEGPAALQYAGGQGDPRLREVLTDLMRHEGIHGSGGDVVVTEGSQQALDLVSRMFCDPGDVIVAEGPPTWAPSPPSRSTRSTCATCPWTTTVSIPTRSQQPSNVSTVTAVA